MKHNISFYTPDYSGIPEGFGCATFGIADVCDVYTDHAVQFPIRPEGIQFCGDYQTVLQQIQQSRPVNPKAAIVLFGNAGNENVFVNRLKLLLNCPVVGGGAAINLQTGTAGLVSGGGQVNVLLITDPSLRIETDYCCIHDQILGKHTLTLQDSRTLLAVDGMDAKAFLAEKKKALGLPETDFEHLTFSDCNGVNAHLSMENGQIKSGRDLEEEMILRHIDHEKVYDKIAAFYDDQDSIIFGCAGLRGILDRDIPTKAMGLFLFGEVCDLGQTAAFGNLMLSKIRFVKA